MTMGVPRVVDQASICRSGQGTPRGGRRKTSAPPGEKKSIREVTASMRLRRSTALPGIRTAMELCRFAIARQPDM